MLKKSKKDDSLYNGNAAKRKRVIKKIAEFIKTIPNFVILAGIVWLGYDVFTWIKNGSLDHLNLVTIISDYLGMYDFELWFNSPKSLIGLHKISSWLFKIPVSAITIAIGLGLVIFAERITKIFTE